MRAPWAGRCASSRNRRMPTSSTATLERPISDVKEGDINWRVDGSVNAPIVAGVLGARALFYYAQNSGVF